MDTTPFLPLSLVLYVDLQGERWGAGGPHNSVSLHRLRHLETTGLHWIAASTMKPSLVFLFYPKNLYGQHWATARMARLVRSCKCICLKGTGFEATGLHRPPHPLRRGVSTPVPSSRPSHRFGTLSNSLSVPHRRRPKPGERRSVDSRPVEAKRFGLKGCEALLPALWALTEEAGVPLVKHEAPVFGAKVGGR